MIPRSRAPGIHAAAPRAEQRLRSAGLLKRPDPAAEAIGSSGPGARGADIDFEFIMRAFVADERARAA